MKKDSEVGRYNTDSNIKKCTRIGTLQHSDTTNKALRRKIKHKAGNGKEERHR